MVSKLRTAELARLAEASGFTPAECHRAMLGGATALMRELSTPTYGAFVSERDRSLFLEMASALEHLQTSITFLDLPVGSTEGGKGKC